MSAFDDRARLVETKRARFKQADLDRRRRLAERAIIWQLAAHAFFWSVVGFSTYHRYWKYAHGIDWEDAPPWPSESCFALHVIAAGASGAMLIASVVLMWRTCETEMGRFLAIFGGLLCGGLTFAAYVCSTLVVVYEVVGGQH